MMKPSTNHQQTTSKPPTNPSAEEPQIPNKMELITLPTDMIEFLYEKVSRDLGFGFVII